MMELFKATVAVVTGTTLVVTIGLNLLMVGIGSWHARQGNSAQAQASAMMILNVVKWLVPFGVVAMMWWWAINR